jgi:hypothetical protein
MIHVLRTRSIRSIALTTLAFDAALVQADAQSGSPQPDPYKLNPSVKPLVIRSFIEDSPARSIAVGFPQGVHYCLNGETGNLEYIWFGGFLDVGPDRGRGKGRGGGWNKILGQKKDLNFPGFPIRFASQSESKSVQYKGYRKGAGAPEILLECQGQKLKEIIQPASGGIGITIRYEFEDLPEGNMTIYVPEKGWKTTSSLKLPKGSGWVTAPKSKTFEVTYISE